MYIILLHPSSTLHQVLGHIRAITPLLSNSRVSCMLLSDLIWREKANNLKSISRIVVTVVTAFEICFHLIWSEEKVNNLKPIRQTVLTVVTTFEIWPSRGVYCERNDPWTAKQRGGRKQSKAGGGGSFQWIVTSAAKLSKFMHYSFKGPSNSENEKWYI